MKYTIEGFQQEELIKNGLDCIDAVILRYIVDFYNTDKMVKGDYKDETYFWLRYDTLIEELPLIKIETKIALSRRLEKCVKSGLMKKWVKKTHQGTYTFFRFDPHKYTTLVTKPSARNSEVESQNSKVKCALNPKVYPKDSSTNDPSTNNSTAFLDLNKLFNTTDIDNVFLTNDQYTKLKDKLCYNDLRKTIINLHEYQHSAGKKYKSHYHTILNWSRREKEKNSQIPPKTTYTMPTKKPDPIPQRG